MKKALYIFAVVACLCGCRRYDIDEVLLQREDISLTVKGELIMSFDGDRCQIGYNDRKNEFRVYKDDLSDLFILTCSERPSVEGQTVKADITWTTVDSTRKRSGLSFTVKKTDADGVIWLWCETESMGVVVKELS